MPKPIYVASSSVHGKGVFASRDIKKGEVLGRYETRKTKLTAEENPFVVEMYDEDGRLLGWAVMVKTGEDSAQGGGWYWYEITSTTDGSSPVAAGNGVPLPPRRRSARSRNASSPATMRASRPGT